MIKKRTKQKEKRTGANKIPNATVAMFIRRLQSRIGTSCLSKNEAIRYLFPILSNSQIIYFVTANKSAVKTI